MTASYKYWQDALRGEYGPLSEGEAFPGFWRRRIKSGGGFLPVAIWPERPGVLIAICDGKQVEPGEVFSFCARHPVTEAEYHKRVETGRWSDEDSAVAESLAHSAENETQDEATLLRDQIAAALAGIHAYAKIEDETAASKAQGLRSRLLELHRDADARREKLVRPHLEAEKATNKIWMPMVKQAKAGADQIRAALGAWETAKDRARKVSEAESGAMIGPAEIGPTGFTYVSPQEQVGVAKITSSYGRSAAVRPVKIAKVEDYDEATTYFRNEAAYRAVIDKLAQAAVDAGQTVPGVTVIEEMRVR